MWLVEYDLEAIRELKKLDRAIRQEIVDYMEKRVAAAKNPVISANRLSEATLAFGGIACVITASYASYRKSAFACWSSELATDETFINNWIFS